MPDLQQSAAPSIRVDVPSLGTIEFPAGTSESDMKRAIDAQIAQSHVAKQEPVPHPIVQRMLSWLPTVGGAAGGLVGGIAGIPELGVGAIPGAIGGAMVGGVAGRTLENTVNAAIGNPAPKSIGESFQSVGNAGLGQGVAEATGAPIAGLMNKFAPALMQSAVKPGLKYMSDVARGKAAVPRVVKTLLDEGINVTAGGARKIQELLGSTNAEINDIIKTSKGVVYPEAVAARADSVIAKAGQQVAPSADVAAAKGVQDEFMQAHAGGPMRPAKPISVQQAQALKTGTYQAIGQRAYGEVKGATTEAEKALARGLKEDIETAVAKEGKQIGPLNRREGNLMEARDAIGKRVALANNRDPAGIGWLAENPKTFLAFLMSRNPAIKSMLARGLYKSAGTVAKVNPTLIRAAMVALGSFEEAPEAPAPAPEPDNTIAKGIK